jgi:hypothetical protein
LNGTDNFAVTIKAVNSNTKAERCGNPQPGRRGKLRGIDDFECLSLRGIDEFVVDEQASSIVISTALLQKGDGMGWGSYGCLYDFPFGSLICKISSSVHNL